MGSLSKAKPSLKRIAIVIPYKDTPVRLNEVLHDIEIFLDSESFKVSLILLFDDASTSPVQESNLHPRIQLHRLEKNQGYGAVQKKAFDVILQSNEIEFVLLLHGDNQYHLNDLLQLLHSIDIHDFGILNRMTTPATLEYHPFLRRISNQILTEIVNFQMKTNYQDLHSGGRVYRSSMLRNIPYRTFSDDFFFDQQMLLYLLGNQASGIEYPIIPDYGSGSSSISYPRAIKYGLQCLQSFFFQVL